MPEKTFNFIKKIIPQPLFNLLWPTYHYSLAFLAAVFYGFPSKNLIVIGVTGTNGKSTVVELIHSILEEAGCKTASVSSLRFKVGREEKQNRLKMTMPGRFALQKFLRAAVTAGCRYVVLEVTSEGIKQFRNKFIRFNAAVLTNVTPEHIESHGSFEKYLNAKLKLFKQVSRSRPNLFRSGSGRNGGVLIVNGDDSNAKKFLQFPAKEKFTYTSALITVQQSGATERFPITEKLITPEGISFKLNSATFSSRLVGEFNFYNILAAVSLALSQKIKPEEIQNALLKISGVSGRMEFVQKKPFAVVVDYAHTPDSLKKIYAFLRESISKSQFPNSKLVCVLGAAGGGRDKWKRPEMGRIAAEFCDEIMLTNEDPYDENPLTIFDEIEKGFSSNHISQITNHKKILDRREAIREALQLAKPGDTVIITGKGAEPFIMGLNNTRIPWDDRAVAQDLLAALTR